VRWRGAERDGAAVLLFFYFLFSAASLASSARLAFRLSAAGQISPVLRQHYPMLQRNLLYTGVTRGKRLLVLLGQKKAVASAVRNVSSRRRRSKLREWLLTKEQNELSTLPVV
jgi:hypothetical protein